jgi:hypothetical protein
MLWTSIASCVVTVGSQTAYRKLCLSLYASFSEPATINTRPFRISVAEIGLIGMRSGCVTHCPSTCGTLTGHGCATAIRGTPRAATDDESEELIGTHRARRVDPWG